MEMQQRQHEVAEAAQAGACYFHRDITRGSYGGDVNCLQEFLRHEGFFDDAPSGFFGQKTEKAVSKWQNSVGINPAAGYWGPATRAKYAQLHKLPTAETLRGRERQLDTDGVTKKCIDVCSQYRGVESCQTRCVRDESEMWHACQEACQVSFSAACDKANPPRAGSNNEDYRSCLSALEKSCRRTCAPYENEQ
eukprot:jgi/Chlat1/8553/Chrsp82S07949